MGILSDNVLLRVSLRSHPLPFPVVTKVVKVAPFTFYPILRTFIVLAVKLDVDDTRYSFERYRYRETTVKARITSQNYQIRNPEVA